MDLFLNQVKFLKISILIMKNDFVSCDIKTFDFWTNFLNFELDCIDVMVLNFYRDPKIRIF